MSKSFQGAAYLAVFAVTPEDHRDHNPGARDDKVNPAPPSVQVGRELALFLHREPCRVFWEPSLCVRGWCIPL